MKFKRVMAFLLSATMILGTGVITFASAPADPNPVLGRSTIEYDNSETISYNSVTVPTVATTTYNFILDPTQLFNKYEATSAGYTAGTTAFFTKTNHVKRLNVVETAKKVYGESYNVDNDNTSKLYSRTYQEATDVDWKSVFEATDENIVVLKEDAEKYFVWVPTGDPTIGAGQYAEITNGNIKNYFKCGISYNEDEAEYVLDSIEPRTETSFTEKKVGIAGSEDYELVFDGKIYKYKYEELTVDSADAVLAWDNYYDEDSGEVKNLYYDKLNEDTGNFEKASVLDEADLASFAPELTHSSTSDSVVVANKTMKDLTVTATVKLSNLDGLEIVSADDNTPVAQGLLDNASDVSMLLAVHTSQPATEAGATGPVSGIKYLKESTSTDASAAKTATANITLSVPANAAISEGILRYRTDEHKGGDTLNDTSTHSYVYHNYVAANTATLNYPEASFYLEAMAKKIDDTTDDGKKAVAAWKAYAAKFDATDSTAEKPKISVVYDVKETEEASAGDVALTYNSRVLTAGENEPNAIIIPSGAFKIDVDGGTDGITVKSLTVPGATDSNFNNSQVTENSGDFTISEGLVNLAITKNSNMILVLTKDDTDYTYVFTFSRS